MNVNSHPNDARDPQKIMVGQTEIKKILGSLPTLDVPRSFRLSPEMVKVKPPMPRWTLWLSRASAAFAMIFVFTLSVRLIAPPPSALLAARSVDMAAQMEPVEEIAPMMAPSDEMELSAAPAAAAEPPLPDLASPKEAPQEEAPAEEDLAISAAPAEVGMGGGGAPQAATPEEPIEDTAPMAASMDEQPVEAMPEASAELMEQPMDDGAIAERSLPENLPGMVESPASIQPTSEGSLLLMWITGIASILLLSGLLIYRNLFEREWRARWTEKLDHEK